MAEIDQRDRLQDVAAQFIRLRDTCRGRHTVNGVVQSGGVEDILAHVVRIGLTADGFDQFAGKTVAGIAGS